jgi:hypothetical protein
LNGPSPHKAGHSLAGSGKKITTILPEKLKQQIAIRAFFSNLFFVIEGISSPRLSIADLL